MTKDLFKFLSFVLGAMVLMGIMHEMDMQRNCKRTGNASSWIFEIKCNEMKGLK